jgi:small-conductance mechanosensitive channel
VELVLELAGAVAVALAVSLIVRWVLSRGRLGEAVDTQLRRLVVRSTGVALLAVGFILVVASRSPQVRQELLEGLVAFTPRLVVGVGLFVVALVLGRLTAALVFGHLRSRSAVLAARVRALVFAGWVVIGLVLALSQMGVDTGVLLLLLGGLVGAIVLAVGLSVGLGALPLARQIAAGRHVEDRFRAGQWVRVGEIVGRIEHLGLASASIVGDDGSRWEVPYQLFLGHAVEVRD